ncbi:MAG TPA: hypothetical protein VK983_00695 [Candidatus Limnocylindrales bacterium]|nr:hypothetical protein [Candidatus Limnocylindrales bacterium]
MYEVPSWKQNLEFMAEVVKAQKLGIYDSCPEPLTEELGDGPSRMAYEYALDRYATSQRFVRLYGDEPLPVEKEVADRFGLSPERTLSLGIRALRDVNEIHGL